MTATELLYFTVRALCSYTKSTVILAHNSDNYVRIYPSISVGHYVITSYCFKQKKAKLPFKVFKFNPENIEVREKTIAAWCYLNNDKYKLIVPRLD